MSERSAIEAAARALGDSSELTLACHVGPDGDALGSMMGLAVAASDAGKKVQASFGSPFVVPDSLSYLPLDLLVPPGEMPARPKTMVVLDAGSPERLGDLGANAAKAETLVVIDHHVTNEGFGDIAVVDGEAAATGELVFDLLGILGWPVTEEVALCLLTALVTDTGRFQYSSTRPRTFRIAADLVAAGARPEQIGRHVYEEAPFGYLKAAGVALARCELDEDRGVVSTVLGHEDLEAAGVTWSDTDSLIDLLRLAEEADVAALVKVYKDGRVKVSLRSRGETDVGALASEMGGGGHRLAAGFTVDGADPRSVLEQVHEMVGSHR